MGIRDSTYAVVNRDQGQCRAMKSSAIARFVVYSLIVAGSPALVTTRVLAMQSNDRLITKPPVSRPQCNVQSVYTVRAGLKVRFSPSILNDTVIMADIPKWKILNYRAPVRVIFIPFGRRAMTSHIANTECLLVASGPSKRIGLEVQSFITGFDGKSFGSTEFVPTRMSRSHLRDAGYP